MRDLRNVDLSALKAEVIDQAYLDGLTKKRELESSPEFIAEQARQFALSQGMVEMKDHKGRSYFVSKDSRAYKTGDLTRQIANRDRIEAEQKQLSEQEQSQSPVRQLSVEEAKVLRGEFVSGLENIRDHRWFKKSE